MIPVLSIAGSDPSGGAGLQADLKTFAAFGCYGMAAPTALTVQNTLGVTAIHRIAPEIVVAQIAAVLADIAPAAIKIGMLAAPEIADAVFAALAGYAGPIVLDPVLAATRGPGAAEGLAAALRRALPRCALVTPNLAEAASLTGTGLAARPDEMAAQAQSLLATGAGAALVKGGHLSGAPLDVLADGDGVANFPGRRIATPNDHGTGCALSSAIAARLAQGAPLRAAVAEAKAWLESALAAGAKLRLGQSAGPPDHGWAGLPGRRPTD